MFKIITFFLKISWKQILEASIASFAAAGLTLWSLKFLKEIVSDPEVSPLLNICIISGLIITASAITLIVGKRNTKYFELKLADTRKEFAEKFLHAQYEKVQSKLGSLAPILLFEIEVIGGFGRTIPEFIVAVVQVTMVFVYLFILSWKLSLIVLLLFILVISIMMMALPQLKKIENDRSKSRIKLHEQFHLMRDGFKDLIMNSDHGNSFLRGGMDSLGKKIANANTRIHLIKLMTEQAIYFVLLIGTAIAFILYFNWTKVSDSEAAQFVGLMLYIMPSFVKIIGFLNQVKKVENALDQIDEFETDVRGALRSSNESIGFEPKRTKRLIRLKDFEFSYSENGFKLGPINLEVNENEIVIIKGGNGSGKTTLFNSLAGLLTSKKGELLFQDDQVSEDNLRSYRNLIAASFTDSPVFENLEYISNSKLEKVRSILEDFELDQKTVFERDEIQDAHLSFGQRGRLTLMRLILEDKPIYMLDEWAANQDIHFKDKFYEKIIPELKSKGKTIILISHDDRYYKIADRVITLRNGLVVEQEIC